MVLTIIITILVVLILEFIFLKAVSPTVSKLYDDAIAVSCYVNTYHYSEDEEDRVRIGQDRFYKSLFGDKKSSFKKDMVDFIFWTIYTQMIDKPLRTIPIDVNMHNNRCLSDGEDRCSGRYLDEYQEKMLDEFDEYLTECEKQKRRDCDNISCESEASCDK